MTLSKLVVLIISMVLAFLVCGIFPAVSVVNGGAGQMIAVIFLTVGFKAAIDYLLAKRKKKREAKQVQRPSAQCDDVAGLQ